jgi:putative transposase
MERFKKLSSRYLRPARFEKLPLWQRGYDDVAMPGMNAIVRRIRYMHDNPVRRGLIVRPEEYLWSSAREMLNDEKGIVTLRRL